jgi:hypothetical protein
MHSVAPRDGAHSLFLSILFLGWNVFCVGSQNQRDILNKVYIINILINVLVSQRVQGKIHA